MEISKSPSGHPTVIPPEICQFLGLGKEDVVRFDIENDKVVLGKMTPDKVEDFACMKLTEEVFAVESLSDADEEAFKDW